MELWPKARNRKGAEQILSRPKTKSLLQRFLCPKVGDVIRGIGEKFASSMSVSVATSPSRSGFGSQISLSYDSEAGNGPFGFGWSLSLPSIRSCSASRERH